MANDSEPRNSRAKTTGRPLPPQWRRDWLKSAYYGFLNSHEEFTSALRRTFDDLEKYYGPYLFRDVGDDVPLLLGILADAVRNAGDRIVDDRTRWQVEQMVLSAGTWAVPSSESDVVQQLTSVERRNLQATVIRDVIGAVISTSPDHPWRGRIRGVPEHLARQNPVNREWMEMVYRDGGDPNWAATAEEFEREHNTIWPDAGPEVQVQIAEFCLRHALPTVRPLDDGPADVWHTYRRWRQEGGSVELAFKQRWVTTGGRPTLVPVEVDANGYEVPRIDPWRAEPETIYPPHLLPLKFSPYNMTVDRFMEHVVDKMWADVRANLNLQASLLADQMPSNWRPVNSQQRDVALIKARAERLYRYVAEGLSVAQLTRYPRNSAVAARSTVFTQIHDLAKQLGVDLTTRNSRAR